ncbi:hypothetical protein [Dictyobacter formicarum]|uniref:Uncharacterized protein n=1 Tax=Dictyobacter formicarum TaxID=2778368 RepID=A0ABQ3VNI6_9CHLR|nr:hypothetical protein [Dictyobacter formicarum]GHO87373.1 hypothetical protein KSZ_53790 [Dictyobacter formicarum]
MEPSQQFRSHLFTLRVWQEEVGGGQVEWRGKVQLVTGNDVRYFRQWQALAPLLQSMLQDAAALSNLEKLVEAELPDRQEPGL